MLQPLIKQAKKNVRGNIKRVYGDGAYDSKNNFNFLNREGIEPIIKIRKNATTRARGSVTRAEYTREMKKLGYKGWKDKYKYGQRWAVETFFSGLKRMYGETTRAKTIEGLFREVKFKFLFYNMMLNL